MPIPAPARRLPARLALLACAPLLASTATPTHAATYSLSINVSNVFSPDFSQHPYAFNNTGSDVALYPFYGNGTWTYQVDVYVSISDLGPDQRGFGNLLMDIVLPAGVTQNALVPGWQADFSNTDTNGLAPRGGTPLWDINLDAGPSASDLQGILVTTAAAIVSPSPTDFRARVGQITGPTEFTPTIPDCVNAAGWPDGKTYIGSVFLDRNVVQSGFNTVVFNLTQASYQSSDGTLITDTDAVLHYAILTDIPEPSSLSILALAAIPGLRRRRRRH
jgi:hypothetical protein